MNTLQIQKGKKRMRTDFIELVKRLILLFIAIAAAGTGGPGSMWTYF
jgi:hypothetical protein